MKGAPMEQNHHSEPPSPIATGLPDIGLLVDLGGQNHDRIRRLKRGTGPLALELQTAVLRSRKALGIASATEIVPVVVLYRCAKPDYIVIELFNPVLRR